MQTINTYYTSNNDLDYFIKQNSIEDSSKLLIQIFTYKNDFDFIDNLRNYFSKNFPLASLIGSTTDGEIEDGHVATKAIVISFSLFDKVKLKTYISNEFESYFHAGKNLALDIIEKDTKVIISFIDGLSGNGEEYLNGIHSINKKTIVAGGLAGDYAQFKKTYIFTKDKIYSKGVVGVSLSSDTLNVYTDYSFNWLPVGQKLRITKAEKNVVYMIDDKTAVDTYAYYLGKDISELLPSIGIEFPLIIEKDGIEVARAAIGKNDDGSLIFAGNIQEMDYVRFGYGDSDDILDKTQNNIDKLYKLPIETIFIYSCMARRRFMPEEIENETLVYEQIAPTSGFYTYGEFFSNGNTKELLNQSMTILALSESNKSNKKKPTLTTQKKTNTTIQALSHLIHVSTKELEEKEAIMLAQSRNAAMGEMLNMIAHQWRQPLNIISMSANNILLDIELENFDQESIRRDINSILKQSSNLSQTINDFKNYFAPSQEKEEISIKGMIDDIKEIVGTSLEDNNIDLIIENQTNDTTIFAHKHEIIQVLLSMINNSKDAFIKKDIKKQRKIIITIKESEENIILDVSDNAGGIDETILKDIFNPYFTTKNQLNGTGLGLYMSKIIVEKYINAELLVQNTANGVCFSIRISKQ